MILALAERSTLNDFKSRTSSKEGYDLSVVGLEGCDFVCAPTKERNGQFGSTFPAIGRFERISHSETPGARQS